MSIGPQRRSHEHASTWRGATRRPTAKQGRRWLGGACERDAEWRRRVASVRCPYHRPMTSQTDTDLSAAAKLAIEYLREHDAEHLAQLDEFLSIESVSADPERAGEVRRTAQWIVDEMTRIGVEPRHDPRDEPSPDRDRRVDEGRRGCADRAGLLPLRRAADRSAGRVDPPAVRASPRGRPGLRARRGRRQGPAVHAPEGGRGLDGRRRPPAGQPPLLLRGRRGGRLGAGGGVHRRACRPADRRTSASSPTETRTTTMARPRSATACAGSPTGRSGSRARTRTSTPANTAAASTTRPTSWSGCSPP